MFKNLAVALLVGAVSAQDASDVIDDAINSTTVNALADQEPNTIQGMTQAPKEDQDTPSFAQGEGDEENKPKDAAGGNAKSKSAAAAANAKSKKAATANANAKAAQEIKQNAIDAVETQNALKEIPDNKEAQQLKPKSTTPAPPAGAPPKTKKKHHHKKPSTSMYDGSYVTPA